MNALRQIESNGTHHCAYDHEKMDDLTSAVSNLTASVSTLTSYYKEMTRWLLIVVCVIALGKELLGIVKDAYAHSKKIVAEQ